MEKLSVILIIRMIKSWHVLMNFLTLPHHKFCYNLMHFHILINFLILLHHNFGVFPIPVPLSFSYVELSALLPGRPCNYHAHAFALQAHDELLPATTIFKLICFCLNS